MKALVLASGSVLLSAIVLTNAYYQKKQFYPSIVYITKSNPSMAVLYIQAFVFVVLMGKLVRKLFFGQLRAAEMEHLIERSWYAVTETCLAFTVFRDDFSPRFVALFTLLLFLKCFHWLAEDRVDYMERSPVISFLFHLRAVALMAFLAAVDIYFINHAYYSTLIRGASVQLVFGFEYAILLTMVATILVKYILHTIDLQSENPWEKKAVYMLYTDLVLGFVKVILYLLFLAIMIKVHTFPLFAIRPMYLTVRAFKKALNDVVMSRRAIRNMNTLYPDATAEDLAATDNICIICREEMTVSCKKLPCGHIFHSNCLRSWFQRQQTCPTCRMDVLRQAPSRRQNAEQQQQQQQQQQQHNQQQAQPGAAAAGAATVGAGMPAPPTGASPQMPPFMMMPPFPFMPPFGMSPPVPSNDLKSLNEEELRKMEGMERQHLQARIQWLRDIHATLDSAMLQIQQYTQVTNSLGLNPPGFNWSEMPPSPVNVGPKEDSPVKSSDKEETPKQTNINTDVTSSDISKDSAEKKEDAKPNNSNLEYTDLEGAVGFTVPTEELMPEWSSSSKDDEDDTRREMRMRRLAKFSSSDNSTTVKDNIGLD